MMLSPHFSVGELACRDGCVVPDHLLDNARRLCNEHLEILRVHLGRPVVVMSGYRTPSWNKGKGVDHSQHLLANAADVRVEGMSPEEVHAAALKLIAVHAMPDGGLGLYPAGPTRAHGWVHVDRARPRRWNG